MVLVFIQNDVSETEVCFLSHAKPILLCPIDIVWGRDKLYRLGATSFLSKIRTVRNVQEVRYYNDTLSSQTFRFNWCLCFNTVCECSRHISEDGCTWLWQLVVGFSTRMLELNLKAVHVTLNGGQNGIITVFSPSSYVFPSISPSLLLRTWIENCVTWGKNVSPHFSHYLCSEGPWNYFIVIIALPSAKNNHFCSQCVLTQGTSKTPCFIFIVSFIDSDHN
jgi:hypothetical protein